MRQLVLACALYAAAASPALALHAGDIYLEVQDDHIVTGQVESDGSITVPAFVFPSVFGDSGFSGFTANPGFDCYPGTFTPDTQNGFNILDALLVWNGDGFEPTGGETLTISFSSQSVTSGDGFVEGFGLFVPLDGGWHRHFNLFLNPPDGEPLATPGVYLLNFELWSTDAGLETSDPFWIVFNHEVDEATHLAAMEWAQAHLPGDACPADIDGSGAVDVLDLLEILSGWGACPDPPEECPADLTGDGAVDVLDILEVLAAWGPC